MARRFVPFIVFGVFVLYLAAPLKGLIAGPGDGFDLAAFRQLPVSVNGRVQPFDTAALISLQRIRGTNTVPAAAGQGRANGRTIPADAWLLEVLAKPEAADARPIFPVRERALLAKLSLPATRGAATTYLAFQDVRTKVAAVSKETERIAKMKDADRAPWERELLTLRAKLIAYERLKNSVQPNSLLQHEAKDAPVAFAFADELASYRNDLSDAHRIAERKRAGGTERLAVDTEQRLRTFSGKFEGVSRIGLVAMVPPRNPGDPREKWATTGTAIVESANGKRLSPSVAYVAGMTSAFAQGKPRVFNETLAKYGRWLTVQGYAPVVRQARLEAIYNALQPFARAIAIYAVGLVLLGVAWYAGSRTLRRSALPLVPLAFALHSAGLVFAFQLAGRPSGLTLAGWALALASLVLAVWRRSAGVAAAAAIGLVALAASFALTPGGGAVIVRNVLTIDLLAAVAAAAIALGAAGAWDRLATSGARSRSRRQAVTA